MSDTNGFRPRTAMVLAAGLGKRMRPITATVPKPLIEIGGRSMLDHALDRLVTAGVETAVVNVHYLADLVEARLARRRAPRIVVSNEREKLLETGGGTKKALPLLGPDPFVVFNTDTVWIEGARSAMESLFRAWDPARMDVLLLLAGMTSSIGFEGLGDFSMDAEGRLRRRGDREIVPFVYAGVSIHKPGFFADTPDGAWSLNLLFDRAAATGRLHGVRLDGIWLHVGTPETIPIAEAAIARSAL